MQFRLISYSSTINLSDETRHTCNCKEYKKAKMKKARFSVVRFEELTKKQRSLLIHMLYEKKKF